MDQYYYKVNECTAASAYDADCICWHNKGEGPFPDADPCNEKYCRCVPATWRVVMGAEGFEPPRDRLRADCSTTELRPRELLGVAKNDTLTD